MSTKAAKLREQRKRRDAERTQQIRHATDDQKKQSDLNDGFAPLSKIGVEHEWLDAQDGWKHEVARRLKQFEAWVLRQELRERIEALQNKRCARHPSSGSKPIWTAFSDT